MEAERAAERDFVVRTARENDVKFIRLWFTDILGHLKGFAITVEDLEDAIEQGVGFDGAAIEGFARIDESDMRAFPDPTTFTLLPWRPRQNAVARMFCDIRTPRGEPFIGDPRFALKRNLERLAKAGYTYYVGPELEFFYLKDSQTPEPLDQQGYYDQVSSYPAADLRRDTVLNLADMGIPVKYSHHEGAHSQHEIDLQYTDALTMADNVMTFRLIVREIALEHGVHATFMPKPLTGVQGSGMHTHLSLFRNGVNAFYDPESPDGLSDVARGFVAGLLHHAREITAVTNQLVNSYKRLVTGYEAPVNVSWARSNRAALIRVPTARTGGVDDTTRIEYRSPDPACNPYLAFAVILAAGMKGIEQGYELPLEAPPSMTGFTEHGGLIDQAQLPQSLAEALDEMEKSDLVADTLGDHLFSWFLRNKRREWNDYKAQVTPFELDRYYSSL